MTYPKVTGCEKRIVAVITPHVANSDGWATLQDAGRQNGNREAPKKRMNYEHICC